MDSYVVYLVKSVSVMKLLFCLSGVLTFALPDRALHTTDSVSVKCFGVPCSALPLWKP